MKKLIIVGASGFGREVAWLVERINAVCPTWTISGFLDDNAAVHGQQIGGYPVLGGCGEASRYPDAFYVCAIGAGTVRKTIIERMTGLLPEIRFATLVDPTVILSGRVTLGEGCVICAGTIITVDISIGRHVIINLDCTVGHDARIGDFVTLYPSVNVSGITEIGPCSEMGTGAQIIQAQKIGAGTIIGAGSVVVRDIPDGCTAVGAPAKVIKS